VERPLATPSSSLQGREKLSATSWRPEPCRKRNGRPEGKILLSNPLVEKLHPPCGSPIPARVYKGRIPQNHRWKATSHPSLCLQQRLPLFGDRAALQRWLAGCTPRRRPSLDSTGPLGIKRIPSRQLVPKKPKGRNLVNRTSRLTGYLITFHATSAKNATICYLKQRYERLSEPS